MEAWSKIYQELRQDDTGSPDTGIFCGPRNELILNSIAPWLTAEENAAYSEKKEAMYRQACIDSPEALRLAPGTEILLQYLKDHRVPFTLVSASIKSNIDFYFRTFGLDRWFKTEDVVYDNGTYADKGEMYLEAARRLKVSIENCLIFEDSPSSIRHARQLSPGCIVALGSTASADVLLDCGADRYVRDFSEFDCAWLEN